MAVIQRIIRIRQVEKPKLTLGQYRMLIARRNDRVWHLFCAATAFAFFSVVGVGEILGALRQERFHEVCGTIENGTKLEQGRFLAADRGLVFEEDEDALRRTNYSIYSLRPDNLWPVRLGCRFEVRDAQLFRTRTK